MVPAAAIFLGILLVPASSTVARCADAQSGSAATPPAIELREELTDRNPAGFARRLGDLLGLEVRLPVKVFRKLSVPAGQWTAAQILNHVAQQSGGLSWQHVFELRTQVKGGLPKPSPVAKLPVTGIVTLRADGASFPRVVELVQEAGVCKIRLPDGIPPGRFRVAWKDTPLEQVLADLGRAGGLRLTRVVIFERPEDAQQAAEADQEAQLSRETLQQGEVANRLQELYGFDAYGEDFPWETIDRGDVSASLGRELDLDPALVDTLMERIRLEVLTRQSE